LLLLIPFLGVLGMVYALRGGYVPARYLPFGSIELDQPGFVLFNDWRLASLRRDREACLMVLDHPGVEVELVEDRALVDGCGWENAVRIKRVGGVAVSPTVLSCPAAAAFASWVIHEVQPAAGEHLKQGVAGISHFGSYACRNMRTGGRLGSNRRSEHATADAIDVSAFKLEDGTKLSVLRDWEGSGNESRFLRSVHRGACRYFRVVLGPEANALHRNHFHLDRGWLWSCR